ncbi:MAG: lactate racemase domain-containing protein, partial [Desulfobacterales bacterium]
MATGKGSPDKILLEEDVKAIIADGTPAKMFANKRVLVLTPDATRTCPLPMMIRAIQALLGTKAAKLDFMVALGTHTPLPEKEILKLYGITTQQRQAQFRNSLFLNHRWDRPQTFRRIGYMSAEDVEKVSQGRLREKVPIDINKKIYDYDLVVILG